MWSSHGESAINHHKSECHTPSRSMWPMRAPRWFMIIISYMSWMCVIALSVKCQILACLPNHCASTMDHHIIFRTLALNTLHHKYSSRLHCTCNPHAQTHVATYIITEETILNNNKHNNQRHTYTHKHTQTHRETLIKTKIRVRVRVRHNLA